MNPIQIHSHLRQFRAHGFNAFLDGAIQEEMDAEGDQDNENNQRDAEANKYFFHKTIG